MKEYTPEEVARRVLSAVLETCKTLTKSNTAHETEIGEDPSNELAQCPEHLSKEKIKKKKDAKSEGESEEHEESESPEQEHEEHESEAREEDEHESPEHEENESEEEEAEEQKEKKKFPFQKSEKGIDLLKNFLGKREEGIKGVHETFGGKKGVSTMGQKIRDAKEDLSDTHNLIPSAKNNAKRVISEQKAMKKPNLPKSENLEKAKEDIKGVHKPAFGHQGHSDVGVRIHPKAGKDTKEYIKEVHKQVIKEQKAMKKPNLPKSEYAMDSEKVLAKDKMDKTESKHIHEMTRVEYENKFGKPKKNTTVTGGFHPHKEAVETALNQGKKVSDKVLADYPDLKKK